VCPYISSMEFFADLANPISPAPSLYTYMIRDTSCGWVTRGRKVRRDVQVSPRCGSERVTKSVFNDKATRGNKSLNIDITEGQANDVKLLLAPYW
jgi:hypothetical protein